MQFGRLLCLAPIALLPCACGPSPLREAKAAERQYEIVSKAGSKDDLCAAAGRAAQAWLRAENENQYREWKVKEDIECQTADIARETGD